MTSNGKPISFLRINGGPGFYGDKVIKGMAQMRRMETPEKLSWLQQQIKNAVSDHNFQALILTIDVIRQFSQSAEGSTVAGALY